MLPYTQQAVSGTQVQSVRNAPPVRRPIFVPASRETLDRARMQMMNAGNAAYKAIPNGLNIRNVQHNFLKNGNPSLMGGLAEVDINGETIRVPNALLQQLMFTDAWNNGRTTAVKDMFMGQNPNSDLYKYSTYGAQQGRMESLINDNPEWSQQGELNPYMRAKNAYENAQQGQVPKMGQPAKEQMVVGGALQKSTSQDQNNYNSAAQEWQRQDVRGGARRGEQQARDTMERMQKLVTPFRPTYSNVPIKETYIRN